MRESVYQNFIEYQYQSSQYSLNVGAAVNGIISVIFDVCFSPSESDISILANFHFVRVVKELSPRLTLRNQFDTHTNVYGYWQLI